MDLEKQQSATNPFLRPHQNQPPLPPLPSSLPPAPPPPKSKHASNKETSLIVSTTKNTEEVTPFKTESLLELVERCKNEPRAKKLIGDLIYINEQVILFAPTGLGKSLLAFHFALSVSIGESIDLGSGVILENEVGKVNTLFFDFELSNRQLIDRIGKAVIPNNLFISKIDRGQILEGSPKEIFELLKNEAEKVKAKFIIVDNISKIGNELEKGDKAVKFMEPLWSLVRHEGYTILVIAHTPKMDKKFAITPDSLGGSSKLGQLADALIGMNEVNSKDGSKVYIKQIKNRNNAKIYGKSNVICTEIRPDKKNFVRHFAYKTCPEENALNEYKINDPNISLKIHAEASHIYYGSFDKACEAVNIPASTLKQRANTLKDKFPNDYAKLQSLNHTELLEQIKLHKS